MGRRSALSARPAHSAPGLGQGCGIAGALRLWDCRSPWTPRSCQEGLWPEPFDPAQDLREQGPGYRHLGQLGHDVATTAHEQRSGVPLEVASDHRLQPSFARRPHPTALSRIPPARDHTPGRPGAQAPPFPPITSVAEPIWAEWRGKAGVSPQAPPKRLKGRGFKGASAATKGKRAAALAGSLVPLALATASLPRSMRPAREG
jgi:hypothetical protein